MTERDTLFEDLNPTVKILLKVLFAVVVTLIAYNLLLVLLYGVF